MTRGVRWPSIGPGHGYGEASAAYISALRTAGVPVSWMPLGWQSRRWHAHFGPLDDARLSDHAHGRYRQRADRLRHRRRALDAAVARAAVRRGRSPRAHRLHHLGDRSPAGGTGRDPQPLRPRARHRRSSIAPSSSAQASPLRCGSCRTSPGFPRSSRADGTRARSSCSTWSPRGPVARRSSTPYLPTSRRSPPRISFGCSSTRRRMITSPTPASSGR
jgi:hypothetical protein